MAARLTALIVGAIVATTIIAGLIVGAQRNDEGPVDLLVYNGRVYPADGSGQMAEAVAIQGARILRVGSNREIKRLRRPGTQVIDAHGGSVLPGFNDSHIHFLGGGLGLDQVNLLDATTVEGVRDRIARFAADHPDRPWVLGRGWYYAVFPGGLPTRQLLDALVPDRPAYMECYDGHTGWANSKALALAGITRRTPNPRNGVIVKDPRTGEPTGVLKEAALDLIERALPPVTRDDKLRALRGAIAEAHRFGVTSIQNAHGSAEEIELYEEIRRSGDLAVRVQTALSISPGFTEADADRFDAVRTRFPDDPLLKVGAVKLVADGVIEAHTAAMLAPYANRPTRGLANYTPQDLERIVTMMDARGWQIFIHAIGDHGVRMALDAYARAIAANPVPTRGRRHRIEHIETIDPDDIPRFGQLGLIAAMQPFHGNPSANQIDVWAGNIGPERASRAWVWKSLAAAGARLAFGSDWPVVSIDPRIGLNMAVNRTTPDGRPAGGWLPEERLPLAGAIDAYTRGGAYASFDEHRKGTIEPGMLADLVILSTDLFALPPEKLLDARVEATIFDGRVVFERPVETDDKEF